MTEAVEQITIKSRGDLIVSKKTQKTYFTVDTDERRLLCFVPSLYNELPDGATVLVNIRPGRSETDTPSITGMSTESEMKSATEIPRQIERPITETNTREQSIERQVAIKEIGLNMRAGITVPPDMLNAYNAWLIIGLGGLYETASAFMEARNESNRPDTNRWTSPTRQPPEQSTRLIPDEKVRQGIKELFGQDWTNKEWKSTKVMKYIFDFDNTSGGDINKVDLNKLEEQLKEEAK